MAHLHTVTQLPHQINNSNICTKCYTLRRGQLPSICVGFGFYGMCSTCILLLFGASSWWIWIFWIGRFNKRHTTKIEHEREHEIDREKGREKRTQNKNLLHRCLLIQANCVRIYVLFCIQFFLSFFEEMPLFTKAFLVLMSPFHLQHIQFQ